MGGKKKALVVLTLIANEPAVEMGLNPKKFEPVRLEYHAAKLFAGQGIRGTGKTYDDLKPAYQIAILAKEEFFGDGDFFHGFEYFDPVRCVSLGGRSRIMTCETERRGAKTDRRNG